MKNTIKKLFILVILMTPMIFAAPISYGAQGGEYISDIKVAVGESMDEALGKLQDAGYIPVRKNVSEERPELASDYVYVGYRTTTNSEESIEGREASNTGSVFGDAGLMIGGFGMVLGVVIGMISMRIRPQIGKKAGSGSDSSDSSDE